MRYSTSEKMLWEEEYKNGKDLSYNKIAEIYDCSSVTVKKYIELNSFE